MQELKRTSILFRTYSRLSSDDLVTFSQQFASMLGAGLSLIRCLDALEKQTENMILKKVIKDVRLNIEGGSSFSEALAKHPKVFSDFFISLVSAGEKAGVMPEVLDRLASYLESQQALRQKVKSAFAYPTIVGALALLVMAFLVVVIVPIFKDIYARIHVPLPAPTVALITVSNIAVKFWWALLFFVAGVIIGYYRIKDIPVVRRQIDNFKINMPAFGNVVRKAAVSRFIRTFGDMLRSGVSVLQAIDVSEKVAKNIVISELARRMKENVRRGGLITEPLLGDQRIFPPSVVQMMAAGEESGTLPHMLQKSADTLDRDVDTAVKRLVVKVEPILTMLLAAFVAFIALAIYLPIFDLIKQISAK
ncbi:MAG: type II secretion system F family protein [Candidatus Omnitrophota bacterium]